MRRLVLVACSLLLAVAAPASSAGVDGERSVELADVGTGAVTTVARHAGTDGTLSVAVFQGGELAVLDTTAAATTLALLPPAGGPPGARVPWPKLGAYATAQALGGDQRFLADGPGGHPAFVARDGSAPVVADLDTVVGTAVAADGRVALVYAVPGASEQDDLGISEPEITRWPPDRSGPFPWNPAFRLRTFDATGVQLADVPTRAQFPIAWTTDGVLAWTALGRDVPEVAVIDPGTGIVARRLAAPPLTWLSAISPDGTRAAGFEQDRRYENVAIRLWDARTGATLDRLALPPGRRTAGASSVGPYSFTWSPDGTQIAFDYGRSEGWHSGVGVDVLGVAGDRLTWRALVPPGDRWRDGVTWSGDGTRLAFRSVARSRRLPRALPSCARGPLGVPEPVKPPWELAAFRFSGDVPCREARRIAVRYVARGPRAVPRWRCDARPRSEVRCRQGSRTFAFKVS